MRLAVIPARGGSRRIQRKNIRPFHGKPIIAYSIEAAKASGLFDHIWVSSEDGEIGHIAERHGATWWVRDKALAWDSVGTQDVMRDVLMWLHEKGEACEYACCIYATAPLMTVGDLRDLYEWLKESHLHYTYIEGWAYWGKAESFRNEVPLSAYSGSAKPMKRWIDINVEDDWKRAEEMYAALHKEAA